VTVRRFSALSLAAFMLHLNVVRADVACAAHDASPRPDMSAPHDMAAVHSGHDGGPSDDAEESDCETPAQNDCCQAVTPCSPVVGLGAERQAAEWIPTHDAAGARYSTHPLTRNSAPEPPPPRL